MIGNKWHERRLLADAWVKLVPRKEAALHFIELLFGLSPDGGTGVAELIFLVALIIGALTVVRRVVRY